MWHVIEDVEQDLVGEVLDDGGLQVHGPTEGVAGGKDKVLLKEVVEKQLGLLSIRHLIALLGTIGVLSRFTSRGATILE